MVGGEFQGEGAGKGVVWIVNVRLVRSYGSRCMQRKKSLFYSTFSPFSTPQRDKNQSSSVRLALARVWRLRGGELTVGRYPVNSFARK